MPRLRRGRASGPEPWRIKSPWSLDRRWTTEYPDPRDVYHNMLIALDESRGLNNGLPGLWAPLFDRLAVSPGEGVTHLGCGTGYYTAILAELVGPAGKVKAIDIHPEMAGQAHEALAPWPQVVAHADGSATALARSDVLVAGAGVAHPPGSWLPALAALRYDRALQSYRCAAMLTRKTKRAGCIGGVVSLPTRARRLQTSHK